MTEAANSFVFVGCYTEDILFGTGKTFPGKGSGIYSFIFDHISGALRLVATKHNVRNPSFVIQHPFSPVLYAVNEVKDFGGRYSGAISAFQVDLTSGKLKFINQVASLGADPCHLAVDRSGKYIIVANFASGSVGVGEIHENGGISEVHQEIIHEGSSIDAIRQTSAHSHSIDFSPCGTFIYVPDLGMDEIITYKLSTSGYLEKINSFPTLAGGGPRGVVFHPSLDVAYAVNELASSVATLKYFPTTGELELLEITSTLAITDAIDNTSSEIQISNNGYNLYISNRGQNNISIFDINQDTGRISISDHISSGGQTPRHFALDCTDQWIAICNQDSNNIVVKRNADPYVESFEDTSVMSPTCLLFSDLRVS